MLLIFFLFIFIPISKFDGHVRQNPKTESAYQSLVFEKCVVQFLKHGPSNLLMSLKMRLYQKSRKSQHAHGVHGFLAKPLDL